MALIGTKKVELGFDAPDFSLLEPKKRINSSLSNLKGNRGTLIMFICNHCPYVIHLIEKIVEVSNEYSSKGISFIAINSNDFVHYPADSPDKMIEFIDKYKIEFPYLFDETQKVAKSYMAECTPDFNLINSDGKVVYRGRFDSSRPESDVNVNGEELIEAIDKLLSGRTQNEHQPPSMGCSIKWK